MTASINDVVLVGESAPMRQLRALIATVAPTRLPVLIEGATGTGKELVAGLLHQLSGRTGNLVSFNVCAISETMFEDALFGHAKGAYTGASGESLGFLREANGGTVFFDEISGLPGPQQAKLLRAIETGVFRPIGAARDARSEFRPVAATNERLEELVDEGRFRADLRHRLSGIVLAVPALAERVDDIPELAAHFVRRASRGEVSIRAEAVRLLQETPWPGNVRELKQVVDGATAFASGAVDVRAVQTALAYRSSVFRTFGKAPDLIDRRALVAVLEGASWDTERAASALGIHRATIYRRMKRHGIDVRIGGRRGGRADAHVN
ncbi:MAG: sigma 54-interacting transcriptional regulator [bacterium]